MIPDKNYFNPDRMIAVFLLFVLSTASIFGHFFAPLTSTGWQSIFSKILLYFGIFGYAVVIGIILSYYVARAKGWLKEDNKRIAITLGIILGGGIAKHHTIISNIINGLDYAIYVKKRKKLKAVES
mgnify:CR=1 FL=1